MNRFTNAHAQRNNESGIDDAVHIRKLLQFTRMIEICRNFRLRNLQVVFLNEPLRNRAANHATKNQTKGGTGHGDFHGVRESIFRFEQTTVCNSCAVSSRKGDTAR